MYLQVYQSSKYKEFAQGARKNFISVNARRGDVVDRKGNLLATTRSVVTVGMDPQSIDPAEKWKFKELSELLEIPLSVLEEASARKTKKSNGEQSNIVKVRWVKLKEEVDESTYRKIQFLRVKGVYGNYKHSRIYPNGRLASHMMGFVNKEGVPRWELKD